MRNFARAAVLASTLIFSTAPLGGTAAASHGPCEITDPAYRFTGATAGVNLSPNPAQTTGTDTWGTETYGLSQVTLVTQTSTYVGRIRAFDGDCNEHGTCDDFGQVARCVLDQPGPVTLWVEIVRVGGPGPIAYVLTVTPLAAPQAPPQCHDGIDNDTDGQTDYPDDPDCASASDDTELTPPQPRPACSDGLDNDANGQTDYPDDPGCDSETDATELSVPPIQPDPACSDGLDNDANGRTDYPDDPGCDAATDNTEFSAPPPPSAPIACDDGIDNDLDGATDYPADDECSDATDGSEGVPGSDVDPTPSCEPGASVPVCVDIDSGALFKTVSVYDVATVPVTNATVVGRVDRYRVPLPTGGNAVIACVVLVANSQSANPCAEAGGVYLDTTLTLVDESETVSSPGLGSPLPLARICHADYTVTVAGFGVEDVPGYAIC